MLPFSYQTIVNFVWNTLFGPLLTFVMFRVASIFLLASIVALGYAENTKCSGEIETFRKCRESFVQAQKASHQQEQSERQAKMKQCFTR